MQLGELLKQISVIDFLPEHSAMVGNVKGLSTNSQDISVGDLFIGLPGTNVDGGEFWQSALDNGAIAAVVSPEVFAKFPVTNGQTSCNQMDLFLISKELFHANLILSEFKLLIYLNSCSSFYRSISIFSF